MSETYTWTKNLAGNWTRKLGRLEPETMVLPRDVDPRAHEQSLKAAAQVPARSQADEIWDRWNAASRTAFANYWGRDAAPPTQTARSAKLAVTEADSDGDDLATKIYARRNAEQREATARFWGDR